MSTARSARPIVFLFLMLPFGIGTGFVTVTLPYMLVQAGTSLGATASIAALAVLPNTCRFLLGPITDLSLSARRWFLLGLSLAALALVLLALAPVRPEAVGVITALAILEQIAANVCSVPVPALMAHTVRDAEKGRAAGWYQAGNLGGNGLGGGAGLWLAGHGGAPVAGLALAAASLACATAIFFAPDVRPAAGARVGARLRELGLDFRDLVRSGYAILAVALVLSPIGVGAVSNLWSALAPDWHAGGNLVALTTGVLSGIASAVGCIGGGWLADRAGRWWAYFGSGVVMALAALLLTVLPYVPATYGGGVLGYMAIGGICNATFSALVLLVIGRGAAATKYALLSSFGNVPVAYMTALDGWVHDRWGANAMFIAEATLALLCVALALPVLAWLNARGAAARPQKEPALAR